VVLDRGPAVLFCPAVRPDRLVKAAERADVVVIDLEDAVAPGDKATARTALLGPTLDPGRTIARVNGADTEWFADDLHALARSPYWTLILPKAESAQQVAALVGYEVIALCETARGVLAVSQLASCPNTVGLMIGAEDLIVSLVVRRVPVRRVRHNRSAGASSDVGDTHAIQLCRGDPEPTAAGSPPGSRSVSG
jgi:citrate lyase subunit beta/citryl-CoA lyase